MARRIERTAFTGGEMPEDLRGTAYLQEVGADTFVISDLPFTPSSVLAHVLRADDVAIAVSGTVSDGAAVVTLVADCYHVAGRLGVAIYITDAQSNSQCVYACVGNVYRTVSDNELDSGTTIPTLAQLEQAYEDCLAAVASVPHAVLYDTQTLTAEQKTQARANIGAAAASVSGTTLTIT